MGKLLFWAILIMGGGLVIRYIIFPALSPLGWILAVVILFLILGYSSNMNGTGGDSGR